MYLYGMCGVVLNPSCYEWMIVFELRLEPMKNAYGGRMIYYPTYQ